MWMKKLRWLLLLALLMPIFSISHAQEEDSGGGTGVINETNTLTAATMSLNRLWCSKPQCERLSALLYPTLYAVDPVSKLPELATPENNALIQTVENSGEHIQRLTLRDDLAWSDGTPITAYDVYFSYVLNKHFGSDARPYAAAQDSIVAAEVINDHEIEFSYSALDCTTPITTNLAVLPAHSYDPDFAVLVNDTETEEDLLESIQFAPGGTRTLATQGVFAVEAFRPQEDIRLLTGDGQLAYVLADDLSPLDRVQLFLNGETNILFNPPLEDRDELLATPDTQVSQYPGLTGIYISLNLANPSRPYPAYDLEGEPLEQGHHPVFGDVRVRRALQMGLDVQEIIDAAYMGYGTQLAANQLPASWAYDETLAPVPYDPAAAGILLTQAGWRSTGNGIRECVNCLYAQRGHSLGFTLMYPQEMAVVAQFIADQLWLIGVSVNLVGSSPDEILRSARGQSYDAYLFGHTESFPVNPDQTLRFTEGGDRFDLSINTGSYHNPEVADLFEEARNLPGCDVEARAAIYHDIQAVLQEDQPYLWLFAPDEMVAASGGVMGFDPLPNAPLWNIHTWRVVR